MMEQTNDGTKKTKTSKSRRETAVQGTNDSSIVSKCSMAAQGYFEDPYLQQFVSKVTRRAPLIHRGYYVRAQSLDYILKKFLTDTNGQKQVLSLGAGFDSAYFRLHSRSLLSDTVFFEVDFPEVVKRKSGLIRSSPSMLEMVGTLCNQVTDKSPLVEMTSSQYKLLGVDLSQTNTLEAALKICDVDFDRPTLLLSECVLTYMTRRCASTVVRWAAETFCNSVFVLYEQIHPDDAFGLVMQNHFHVVGSPLRSITAFPTIQTQKERFSKLGWGTVEALDMNQFYYSLLSAVEHDRIERLEPFDEHEEWHLKCAHYMVLCGFHGNCGRLLSGLNHTDLFTSEGIPAVDNKVRLERPETNRVLKRFSHGSVVLGSYDVVMSVGGFGEQRGKHMRISEVTLLNMVTMETMDVNPGVDNKLLEVSRMHAAVVGLKDGRVFLIGGRLSPLKLCNQLVAITVSSAAMRKCANSVSNQHEVKMNCGNNCESAEKENSECVMNIKGENRQNSDGNSACLKPITNCDNSEGVHLVESVHNYSECHDAAVIIAEKICDMKVNCDTEGVGSEGLKPGVSDLDLGVTCEVLEATGEAPCPRWRHTAVLYKDQTEEESIVLYGGRTQTCMALGDCYLLNPMTTNWTKLSCGGDVPEPRQSHTASFWNGHMIIAGGLGKDLRPLSSVYLLNIDTLQWRMLPSNVNARYSHTAHVIGDILVLLGGVSFSNQTPGVALIHLPSGLAQEFSLPAPSKEHIVMYHRHTSVAIDNNRILLLGGGGNCFSFGTHLNSSPYVINISEAMEVMRNKLEHQ